MTQAVKKGDRIASPIGEPLQVHDLSTPNIPIRSGPAKRLRPDLQITTPEGLRIALEFRNTHGTPADKIQRFKQAGTPLLEWDISQLPDDPSDQDIHNVLSLTPTLPVDPRIAALHVPTIPQIIRAHNGTLNGETILSYGNLRCMHPGCDRPPTNTSTTSFVHPQLHLWQAETMNEQELQNTGAVLSSSIPRFSCHGHMGEVMTATTPYGAEWYKHPCTPNSVRRSFSYALANFKDFSVSLKMSPTLLGPAR